MTIEEERAYLKANGWHYVGESPYEWFNAKFVMYAMSRHEAVARQRAYDMGRADAMAEVRKPEPVDHKKSCPSCRDVSGSSKCFMHSEEDRHDRWRKENPEPEKSDDPRLIETRIHRVQRDMTNEDALVDATQHFGTVLRGMNTRLVDFAEGLASTFTAAHVRLADVAEGLARSLAEANASLENDVFDGDAGEENES